MTRRSDWLAHQLPVGMTDDDFLVRFLSIFQTVSDTVLHQIDTLPHVFDPAVAPDPMVRLMSRWLGIELVDSSLDDAIQREIVREYSKLLAWRGTRAGMQQMLEVITKGQVTVEDNGGVFPEGSAPRTAPHVRISVESTGWATKEDLLIMIRTELPASVTFELTIAGHVVWPVVAPELENLAVRAGAALPGGGEPTADAVMASPDATIGPTEELP